MYHCKTQIIALLAGLVCFAGSAEAGPEGTASSIGKLHTGIQAGVVLPQLQSELGTDAGVELEVGYQVWEKLSPYFSVGYMQPGVENGQGDPRLTGADYTTETTQRELKLTLGAFWRFEELIPKLNAYAGLGARVWMLESISNGESADEPFLENRETSTRYGGAFTGGGEYLVGPGAAVLQVDFAGSDLPHLVTGDVATTALSVSVGYRFLLL